MKENRIDFLANPTFNTVTGLTNKTFDPTNIVSGRGATEDQLKVVGDTVKDLNDYMDEFGCSDCEEQYAGLRQMLDEMQVAQQECCDNKLTEENVNALIADLSDKLDALETQIEECCWQSGGGGGSGECDGSTVTVSFGWNGPNPITDGGGQVTAVSSSGAAIAGYYLLVNQSNGVIMKTASYAGVSVNGSGHVTIRQGGTGLGAYSIKGVGAVDVNGCEGFINANVTFYFSPLAGG